MTAGVPFLDTDVILRHVLSDNPDQSPKATEYLRQIAAGNRSVLISDLVVFESVFTLEKFYRMPRQAIREALLPLLSLSGIALANKQNYHAVFDHYVHRHSLSFADCFHVELVRRLDPPQIVSFDRVFDRVPEITRIEL
jgi:uncharacterized protein